MGFPRNSSNYLIRRLFFFGLVVAIAVTALFFAFFSSPQGKAADADSDGAEVPAQAMAILAEAAPQENATEQAQGAVGTQDVQNQVASVPNSTQGPAPEAQPSAAPKGEPKEEPKRELTPEEKLEQFAKCLGQRDVVLYTWTHCRDCETQKWYFGDYLKYLKVEECDTYEECDSLPVSSFPSWSFYGTIYEEKLLDLQAISKYSGCQLDIAK